LDLAFQVAGLEDDVFKDCFFVVLLELLANFGRVHAHRIGDQIYDLAGHELLPHLIFELRQRHLELRKQLRRLVVAHVLAARVELGELLLGGLHDFGVRRSKAETAGLIHQGLLNDELTQNLLPEHGNELGRDLLSVLVAGELGGELIAKDGSAIDGGHGLLPWRQAGVTARALRYQEHDHGDADHHQEAAQHDADDGVPAAEKIQHGNPLGTRLPAGEMQIRFDYKAQSAKPKRHAATLPAVGLAGAAIAGRSGRTIAARIGRALRMRLGGLGAIGFELVPLAGGHDRFELIELLLTHRSQYFALIVGDLEEIFADLVVAGNELAMHLVEMLALLINNGLHLGDLLRGELEGPRQHGHEALAVRRREILGMHSWPSPDHARNTRSQSEN